MKFFKITGHVGGYVLARALPVMEIREAHLLIMKTAVSLNTYSLTVYDVDHG